MVPEWLKSPQNPDYKFDELSAPKSKRTPVNRVPGQVFQKLQEYFRPNTDPNIDSQSEKTLTQVEKLAVKAPVLKLRAPYRLHLFLLKKQFQELLWLGQEQLLILTKQFQ